MQKRQATAPSGSRRSKQASVANADDIFSTPGKNTEDAPKYFQKRMNNQSQKRRSNDYIDGVVRRSNDPLGDMSRK
jgi:hypothetical protein